MEIFDVLCLLILNYFTVDASVRVERAATCPKITNFSGRVKYRRRGTRAVFRCPKKFDRYGPKFATCLDDGTWSEEPPLCIKTGCLPLDPSQVNNLDMEVVNGAFVKFTCLENYLLIGETQAYCDGKDWSVPLPRCAAPHELTECDFEEDLCGWTQDDNEEQDWIHHTGATPTGNTGPKFDHTYGDAGNGHYLFFETSNPTMTGHQANLLSPVYSEDLSPKCFDFWYHILGPGEAGHVGSLEVFVLDQSQFIDDDNVKPLFVKEGNQGDKWHRGGIFIDKQNEPFQIAIVATRALSYISDIAIDDVRLFNCTKTTSPEPSTTASQPLTTKTIKTTQTTVKTSTTSTMKTTTMPLKSTTKTTSTQSPTTPTKTVTTASVPRTKLKPATTAQSILTSPSSTTTKTTSQKQAISSSSARTSPTTSLTTQKTTPVVIKKSTKSASSSLPSQKSENTYISTSGTTQKISAPHELTECDFEEDLCGWTQDDNEEQDWIRHTGATPTGNTGPKFDHTYGDAGNGHYLFFKTSNPTITGNQANLLSPVYSEDLSSKCFDFWYHILGPGEAGHVGSLEVFVLDQSQFIDDDNVKPIFVKEGNQGYRWHHGRIFIDKQKEPFQIAIVATRALSYISDIAIDDVRLFNCTKTTSPEPSTTTPQPSTTTTIKKNQTTVKTPATSTMKTTTMPLTITTNTTSTQSPTTPTKTVTTASVPRTKMKPATTTQSILTSQSSTTTKTTSRKQAISSSSARTSLTTNRTTQKTTPVVIKKSTKSASSSLPSQKSENTYISTSGTTQTISGTNSRFESTGKPFENAYDRFKKKPDK